MCCTCKEERGLDSFHNNKKAKDGKAYMCKECKSKKAKAYRESDLGKDSKRAWRENNKDLVNAQKRVKWLSRTEDQVSREQNRKKVLEYRSREKIYKSSLDVMDRRRGLAQDPIRVGKRLAYKRGVRDRLIEDLMLNLSKANLEVGSPYTLYHFKIGGVFKFGIAKYGVIQRYVQEGLDIKNISECVDYVMSERNARDFEKIISNVSKEYAYSGESPFPRTGVTEVRVESVEWIIDQLLEDTKIEFIKRRLQ